MSNFWTHLAGKGRESQGQVRPRLGALFEPVGGLPLAPLPGAETPAAHTPGIEAPPTEPEQPTAQTFHGDDPTASPQTTGRPDVKSPAGAESPLQLRKTPSGDDWPGRWPSFRLNTIRDSAIPRQSAMPEGGKSASPTIPTPPESAGRAETDSPAKPAEGVPVEVRPPVIQPKLIRPGKIESPSAATQADAMAGQKALARTAMGEPSPTAPPSTASLSRPDQTAVEQTTGPPVEGPAIQPAAAEQLTDTIGQPSIRVHIGRIEVKAAPPVQKVGRPDRPDPQARSESPARHEPPYQPPLTLDDYLKQRSGGKA